MTNFYFLESPSNLTLQLKNKRPARLFQLFHSAFQGSNEATDSLPSILFKQPKVPSVNAISYIGLIPCISPSYSSQLRIALHVCIQAPHCLLCVWEPRGDSPQNRIKPSLLLRISEILPGHTFSGDHQPSITRKSFGISQRLSLSPEPFCPVPAEHFLLEHTNPEVGGGRQA